MSVRVNTKFVALLVAILGGITLVIAVAFLYIGRHDTAKYVASGDALMRENKYEEALKEYGRAARQEKTNPAILLKYTTAMQARSVPTSYELNQNVQQVLENWRKIVSIASQSPEATQARHNLLNFYYEGATKLGEADAWKELFTTAQEILSAPASKDQELARQYRAIAQVQKLSNSEADEPQRIAALKEMQAVVDVSPPSARLTYQLALWNRIESAFQIKANRPDRAAQFQQQSIGVMQQFLVAHPEDPEAILQTVKLHALANQRDKALQLLATLEAKPPLDNKDHLLELASLLERIDTQPADPAKPKLRRGYLRAEKLLRAQQQRTPEDDKTLLSLGRNLVQQNRLPEAEPMLEKAALDRPRSVTVDGLRGAGYQQSAIIQLAELHLNQIDTAPDEATRTALIAKMRQRLGDLRKRSREDIGHPDLLEGKIELVENHFTTAERFFDSSNTKFGGVHVESLVLQARALRMLNQYGEAARKLRTAIASPEGRTTWVAYRELAIINLKLNEPEEALNLLGAILTATPDDLLCQQLRVRSLTALSRKQAVDGNSASASATMKKALVLAESLRATGDKPILILLAALYSADKRPDAARTILDAMLQKNPADTEALLASIRLDVADKNNARAIARVNDAIKADPAQIRSLEMLRAQLTQEGATEAQILAAIAERSDPMDAGVASYRFHGQKGDAAKAEQELVEMEKRNPDDPRVITLRFEQALTRQNWSEAQRLAEKAGKLDLDNAQGMFWLGRVELARGNRPAALTALNRGVTLRPRHADGWVLLGDARRQNNDLTGADAAYSTALGLQPNNIKALQSQFAIQDARGQNAAALRTIQKAAEFAPENRAIVSLCINYMAKYGDAGKALKMRQQWAQQDPADAANRRALAALYTTSGQAPAARQVLQKLIAEDPLSLDNIAAMARFMQQTGQPDEGRALLLKFVTDLGAKATASDWLSVARFFVDANEKEQAEAAFRRAIELEDKKVMPATRELADWYFARNDAALALPLYQSVTVQNPEDNRVAHRVVEAMLRVGQFEQAQKSLEAIVARHGQDVQSSLLEGLVAENLGSGDTERAQRAFDRAVQLAPGNAQAYFCRARFNLNRTSAESQAGVRRDLERALDLDPGLTVASDMLVSWYLDPRRSDETSAAAELRRLISKRPDYRPARLQLAQVYLRQKRYSELEELLVDSQTATPDSVIWRQIRAQSFIARGQKAKALNELEQAFAARKNPVTLTGYAVMLLESDQATKADQAISQNPQWIEKSAVLTALRARSQAVLGHADQANAGFAKALTLVNNDSTDLQAVLGHARRVLTDQQLLDMLRQRASSDVSGMTEHAIAQLLLEKGQASEAISQLKTLIARIKPGVPVHESAQRLLALALERSGQLEASLSQYNELLKLHPDDVTLLNNTAYLLAENLKRPAEALPLARKAAQIVPPAPVAQASVLDTLGWVQFRIGNIDEAEIALRRSLQISPIAAVHLHLAEVLIVRKQAEPAREQIIAAQRLAVEQKDKATSDKAQTLLQTLDSTPGKKDAKP